MRFGITGSKHYFTGPITHDPMEIIIGIAVLGLILVIWKIGKFKWPTL